LHFGLSIERITKAIEINLPEVIQVGSNSRTELTLKDIAYVIWRRRTTVYRTLAVAVVLGVLVCLTSPRRYKASGSIQVQNENSSGLDLDGLTGTTQTASDAMNLDINIQTQARILQSDTLALQTIHNLNLADSAEFRSASPSISWIPLSRKKRPGHEADDSNRDASIVRLFHKNLVVSPQPGTRLIQIDYMDSDPKVAAAVVNSLVQSLLNFDFASRLKATELASAALSKQLADLRVKSEGLQSQVAQMQRDSGLYSIGTTDPQGHQQAYSLVLDQFQRSVTTLNDATQNRMWKEAIYKAAQSGDAEMLSSLAGNSLGGGASPAVSNSLLTLQTMRTQEATLRGQLDQLKIKFGPGYPKIGEVQGQLDSLDHSIQDEIKRLSGRALTDFNVADRAFNVAQQAYQKEKVKADRVNDKAIRYVMVRQEADDSRTLYEDLVKRLNEAGIVEGVKPDSISVVDPALVPQSPDKPNIPVNMAAAVALGLFCGTFGVLLVDALDDKVHGPESLTSLDLPVITVLPELSGGRNRADGTYAFPSRDIEAARNLRLEITTANSGLFPQVIVVTSALAEEGKSAVCHNLAAGIARKGRRVLLLDADTGQTELSNCSAMPDQPGFFRVLSGSSSDSAIVRHPSIARLFILPTGDRTSASTELLESDRMRDLLLSFRRSFDVILIDAAPVLLAADARIFSEEADFTLQVARDDVSTGKTVKLANDLLRKSTNRQVIVALTGSKTWKKDHRDLSEPQETTPLEMEGARATA
jgi:succinoglycan biosynthesis transport protein ExoP